MTMGTDTRLAISVLLAASVAACGGSTGNGPNDTLGSGGYGMPSGGFTPGTAGNGGGGGNGGFAIAGAGGGAGNSAICPAGLGPPGLAGLGGSGGDVGASGDGGVPSLTPGVHCDNTTNGNDGSMLAGDWVCPVPSDPIWPAVLPNGTTTVGIFPRLPCPPGLSALTATFSWTSENPACHTTGGTFANPTADSTTFTCETAGEVTITVYFGIRNTECLGEWSTVVQCHL